MWRHASKCILVPNIEEKETLTKSQMEYEEVKPLLKKSFTDFKDTKNDDFFKSL